MELKELFENFLDTYKLQKKYLDKDNNYTMDGKNFIDWYLKESGYVFNNRTNIDKGSIKQTK